MFKNFFSYFLWSIRPKRFCYNAERGPSEFLIFLPFRQLCSIHLVKSILNLKQKTGHRFLDILCVSDRQKCRQLKNWICTFVTLLSNKIWVPEERTQKCIPGFKLILTNTKSIRLVWEDEVTYNNHATLTFNWK